MINNEPNGVCKLLNLILEKESEVRNFFPQGKQIDSKLPGLVVVHPFYFGFDGKKYLQHSQLKDSGRYIPNMRCLMSNSERNLFLFESHTASNQTLELLSSWRSLNGVYLIKTETETSKPIQAGLLFDCWKNMAERILSISKEFEFAGGELYGDISKVFSLNGCLGGAFGQLNQYGVKGRFKEGVCFKSLENAGWNF